jgi:glutamyl-tRNA synthetase
MAELVQTRIVTLSEVPQLVDFMFLDAPLVDEASWSKTFGAADAVAMLRSGRDALASCDWNSESLKSAVEAAGASLGLKLGKAQAPIRVAVTGRTVGPPLFEALELLGRDAVLKRLDSASTTLG